MSITTVRAIIGVFTVCDLGGVIVVWVCARVVDAEVAEAVEAVVALVPVAPV